MFLGKGELTLGTGVDAQTEQGKAWRKTGPRCCRTVGRSSWILLCGAQTCSGGLQALTGLSGAWSCAGLSSRTNSRLPWGDTFDLSPLCPGPRVYQCSEADSALLGKGLLQTAVQKAPPLRGPPRLPLTAPV